MAYPEPQYSKQETAKEYTKQYSLQSIDSIVTKQEDGMLGYVSAGLFATTGSNTFTGNQSISGDLTIDGDIYANQFNVTTSSVNHFTASTKFGLDDGDTHEFTGSVKISGSLGVIGNTTLTGSVLISGSTTQIGNNTITGTNLITGNTIMSGSLEISGSQTRYGVTRNIGEWQLTGSMFTSGSTTITGDTHIGGDLNVGGNITMSGSIEMSGSINLTGSILLNNLAVAGVYRGGFNPQFTDVSGSVVGVYQTGSFVVIDGLCFFRAYVDFATCTNFGNSQYQMQLPFPSVNVTTQRGGTLHQTSGSGTLYNITGVTTEEASTNMLLYYTGTTSYLNWKWNTPVSASTTSSHFDINGTFEIL